VDTNSSADRLDARLALEREALGALRAICEDDKARAALGKHLAEFNASPHSWGSSQQFCSLISRIGHDLP
jgi:hypothetical protein